MSDHGWGVNTRQEMSVGMSVGRVENMNFSVATLLCV